MNTYIINNNYILKAFIAISLIVASCKTSNYVVTQPVTPNSALEPATILYSLPKTVIKIKVTTTKHTFIAGPYARYAKKYLGIEGVQNNDSTYYTIEDIDIDTYIEASLSNMYSISFPDKVYDITKLLQFSNQGLVCLSPFSTDTILRHSTFYDNSFREQINFQDLSIKRNLELGKDTFYRVAFRDSAFVKIPIIKKMMVEKEDEKKAEEAANFIIKTRKRRFKLVAGQYDFLPNVDVLTTSIKELDETEAEYMQLFIGKHYTESHNLYFDITPQEVAKNEGEKILLFRFSEKEGIKALNSNAKPFILEIEPNEMVKLPKPNKETPNNTSVLFYRIPNIANIKVIYDSKLITTRKQSIFQYGEITSIPLNAFY